MALDIQQITIKELLRDEQYKKFILTRPELPAHYQGSKPWKLYVRLKGQQVWKTKQFATYREMMVAFKKLLPKIDDAALNCKALGFRPPIRNVRVKGKTEMVRGKAVQVYRSVIWHPKLDADMERHIWCPYCRRPTIFRVLSSRLHTLSSSIITEPKLRCTICSASEDVINIKNPEKEQAWDANKADLYQLVGK